jgi:folate-binding protein YgfZ
MRVHLRPDRVALRFSGADAERLLRDVLTGHIVAEEGPARWWALLSPQGKVLAEGLAGWSDGAFWLDVHKSLAADFMRLMRMYRLRSHMDIEDLSATHRVGWCETADGGLGQEDVRAGGLGFRVIAPAAETAGWLDESAWLARRTDAGILEAGADFARDSVFAHDLGMDVLDGIDFEKGCFVGQEVVSRMKHRGTARRRPVVVSGEGLSDLATIAVGGRDSGEVGTALNGKAAGIVRLDRVSESAEVTVNGAPAMLSLPAWATYRFGGEPSAD